MIIANAKSILRDSRRRKRCRSASGKLLEPAVRTSMVVDGWEVLMSAARTRESVAEAGELGVDLHPEPFWERVLG